jgi:hypothetical protein
LNWTNWIRQVHRWLSVGLTVGFVVNAVVIFSLAHRQPPVWLFLLVSIPLFLLLPTGLYLLALPYAGRWDCQPRASRPRPRGG